MRASTRRRRDFGQADIAIAGRDAAEYDTGPRRQPMRATRAKRTQLICMVSLMPTI